MFAHFTLPNVGDVARRTVTMVLVAGAVALVACIAIGQPLLGVGACIGLALGIFNFRMISNSVARVSAREGENKRRPLALNTLGRMGIITLVTIGLLLVSASLGFGVLAGVAVFQVIFLANVARSMAKAGPMTSVDDAITANVVDDNIRPPADPQVPGPPDGTRGGG